MATLPPLTLKTCKAQKSHKLAYVHCLHELTISDLWRRYTCSPVIGCTLAPLPFGVSAASRNSTDSPTQLQCATYVIDFSAGKVGTGTVR
jgi:hypothetical protein